ncbi:MAG: ion channel [Firmicutes bacterium]|jgi:voltage-gated potassium channel|uniref:Potassium channel protein n=1 Tax=Sulfobacillus benefaciens TaxID=453960 RepID=A0A2T2X6J2_9FIRM|nr:ion channel [Bacillota bacterium]MCL5015696.1 ion channel [Bacillota bacterium]PSR30120.1 MAG: hypothetical protein C7B43_07520 [Sulfobacillus benefaciens]
MPFLILNVWHRVSRHQILILTILVFVIMFVAAGLFALTQHVSFFTGIYWAVTTVTTVGYGDVTPHNAAGRVIAMGTMLTAIPLAGVAFGGWTASLVSIHLRKVWGLAMNKMHRHLVILGYSPILVHILPDLSARHTELVLIAPGDINALPTDFPHINGDPTHPHVLAQAHLPEAKQIVVLGETDGAVLMTAIEAHRIAPETPIFSITHSRRAAQTLKDLGLMHSVASQDLLGHTLATSLETPHAADFFVALLTSTRAVLREMPAPDDVLHHPLTDYVPPGPATVLAVIRQNRVILPTDNPVIEPSDTLLLLTAQDATT